MLEEDGNERVAECGARVLARAGHVLRAHTAADSLAQAKQRLLALCREASHKGAKAAVQCAPHPIPLRLHAMPQQQWDVVLLLTGFSVPLFLQWHVTLSQGF
jgi:hypothetical protein